MVAGPSGVAGRIHLALLYGAGFFARPVRFRGMVRFASGLGRAFRDPHPAVLELAHDTVIEVDLSDGYWARLIFADYRYEPELEHVLRAALAGRGVMFVDCGANIGYWSLAARAWIGEPRRVVAIEPSAPLFARLRANVERNGGGVVCIRAAVWSEDGARLTVATRTGAAAAATSVHASEDSPATTAVQHVESISLDTVCERFVPVDAQRLVVKLDVEGSEIPALVGARRALTERDPLLIYEDHGNDPACAVSEFVRSELGLDVFYPDERGEVHPMESLGTIGAVKRSAAKGYNFVACLPDSETWSGLRDRDALRWGRAL